MDLSKLSQNEKLAMFGAVAVIVGGLVGYSYGLTVLAVLAALTALAIIFLPQLSPSTSLPGSRGSLLLVAGGIAGVVMLLALVMYLSVIFTNFNFRDLFFIVAVAGGIVLAWASWQEFQAEGGKFQLGSAAGNATVATHAAPAAPAEPAQAAAEPAQAAAEPAPAPVAPPAPPADIDATATAQASSASEDEPPAVPGERPPA